jgi:hypothetical protein
LEQPSNRRVWRAIRQALRKILDHPRTSLAVGLLGLVATVATFVLSDGDPSPDGLRNATSESKQTSPGGQPSEMPQPLLGSDASCNEFRKTAARTRGRQLFVDSPGQIGAGPGLEARILPNGKFRDLLNAPAGSEVEVSARLHNSAYSAAEVVSIAASISARHQRCWRIVVTVTVLAFPKDHAQVGPALILLKSPGSATLEYVKGSAKLLDEKGHALAEGLSDRVIRDGIALPYAVPGGTSYYLNFRVRIKGGRHKGRPAVRRTDLGEPPSLSL